MFKALLFVLFVFFLWRQEDDASCSIFLDPFLDDSLEWKRLLSSYFFSLLLMMMKASSSLSMALASWCQVVIFAELEMKRRKKKETKSRKNRLKIKAFTSDCQRLYYAVSFYIYICVYTIQSILSANPDRFFIVVVDVVSSSIPLQDLLFGTFYLTSLNTVSPSQMVSLRAWITNDVWCWTESFPLSSFLFSSSKKNKIKKKFKERRKKGACEKESDIKSKLMVYLSSQVLPFS